jgi:hypothetical protein
VPLPQDLRSRLESGDLELLPGGPHGT